MKLFQRLVLPVLLGAGPVPAFGTDIVVCIVADNLQGNPTYYGMATTVTRLKCEFTKEDFYPTLTELYRLGWRLIEVVGGDYSLSMGNRGPSPLYMLERESVPVPVAADKGTGDSAGKGSKKK